jgi:hypothetical protein
MNILNAIKRRIIVKTEATESLLPSTGTNKIIF